MHSWNPGKEIWESALDNKMENAQTISILSKDREQLDLTNLKKMLMICDCRTNLSYEENCNLTVNGDMEVKTSEFKISSQLIKPTKQFVSKFNNPMISSSITNDNIFVKNIFDERTEITLQLSNDRREIYIDPLESEGYRVGNYYILTHNQNILTDGGNNLDEINNYYFYVPQEVK